MTSRHSKGFRWQPPEGEGQTTKSPSWKERYRQRCKDRLRDSRFKQLLARRLPLSSSNPTKGESPSDDGGEAGSVPQCNNNNNGDDECQKKMMLDLQALMTSEWKSFQREDAIKHGLKEDEIEELSTDQMIEFVDSIIYDLRKENEASLCEEYEQNEEEELYQAFHRLRTVEVICPVCQKEPLKEGTCSILCKCGLFINTEQDCIGLQYVSDSLKDGTKQHDTVCDQKPSFLQMEDFGISTLVMTCLDCDFHFVVI